jgi:hypothetical protein
MLRMRDYPLATREALAQAAREAGVPIARGLRTVGASDAIIALRAGYRVATLASVDYTKLPLNYHWPSDTPQALHWQTIEHAIAVCERFLRTRGSHPETSRGSGPGTARRSGSAARSRAAPRERQTGPLFPGKHAGG